MKNIPIALLVTIALAAGCMSMKDQVAPGGPSADLIVDARYAPLNITVRSVRCDGRMVPLRTTSHVAGPYRISPGAHTLTVERKVTVTQENRFAGFETLLGLAGFVGALASGTAVSGFPGTVPSVCYVTEIRMSKIRFDAETGAHYVLDPSYCTVVKSNLGRPGEVGGRQPTGPRDGVPAAHDP